MTVCPKQCWNCLKDPADRLLFGNGLVFVIDRLKPSCIVVYGGVPYDVDAGSVLS